MKKVTFFVFLQFVVLFGYATYGAELVPTYELRYASGEARTISWVDPEGPTPIGYEVEIVNEDRRFTTRATLTAGQRSYVFTVNRTGHYIVMVRALYEDGPGPWCLSTNALCTRHAGEAMALRLYQYVAPVGGGGIE